MTAVLLREITADGRGTELWAIFRGWLEVAPLDNMATLAGNDERAVDKIDSLFAHAGDEREILKAWENFLSNVSQVGPPVRLVIESSWKRSAKRGVDAYGNCTPVIVGEGSLQKLLRRNRLLSWAAKPIMQENAELLRGTRSMLILTDSTGVILDVMGDPSTVDLGREIRLSLGGSWNEADVGTNGIGMAIAIGQAVQVHASEHFCEGVKEWTCAAAPILDPRDKSLLGVLDISGPDVSFCQHNLALVKGAAHQVESAILERLLAKRARLLEVCLSSQPRSNEGMVLLDHNGFVVCVNDDASQRINRGEISAALDIGKRLIEPGGDFDVDELRKNLPPDCRAEWLHPVTQNKDTLGAVIFIPRQGKNYLPAETETEKYSSVLNSEHSVSTDGVESSGVDSRESNNVGHATAMVSTRRDAKAVHSNQATVNRVASDRFARIVGRSPVMEVAVVRARKLARSVAPILIEGETGVGKELFASAIQAESSLADGPFVICNCGAVSEELIGSELFGYVKGAFTGASSEGRVGRFEHASGGTLCLDEIGEMPLSLQPYLLRVLDEGFVYRLGDNTPRKVDVRLLAMTNRNLRDEVAAGRFRRDLYYRISVTNVAIPPLRDRGSDMDQLIRHFLQLLCAQHKLETPVLSTEVLDVLRLYQWPGNVRELRNVLESLLLTMRDTSIALQDLPAELFNGSLQGSSMAEKTSVVGLEATERQAIELAIDANRGNLTRTAKQLGISRSTLYRKIDHYQLGHHREGAPLS